MIIAAMLALQSIPFAVLVLIGSTDNRDTFVVGYTAALGLVLSMIVFWDGNAALPLPPAVHVDPRP